MNCKCMPPSPNFEDKCKPKRLLDCECIVSTNKAFVVVELEIDKT